MGAFTGLRDAKRGFSSNPLRPGRYLVRIDECSFFDTEQKGEMWKTTVTILSVEEGDHKPGEQAHIFYKVSAGKKIFQQNVKAFICSVLDVDDSEIGEEEQVEITGEQQRMAGLVAVVSGVKQTSKEGKDEKGNPRQYTKYAWQPSLTNAEIVEAIGEDGVARFFPNGLPEEE